MVETVARLNNNGFGALPAPVGISRGDSAPFLGLAQGAVRFLRPD
jgi:hypothetical protein